MGRAFVWDHGCRLPSGARVPCVAGYVEHLSRLRTAKKRSSFRETNGGRSRTLRAAVGQSLSVSRQGVASRARSLLNEDLQIVTLRPRPRQRSAHRTVAAQCRTLCRADGYASASGSGHGLRQGVRTVLLRLRQGDVATDGHAVRCIRLPPAGGRQPCVARGCDSCAPCRPCI